MSAKGKGKGKKGKKGKAKDKDKLKAVDRTFYELTITDLNRKLSHLRSHLATLDDTNINLTEKLRELHEDRTDVAAHLDRTLDDRNNIIRELEERLREIERVRETENTDNLDKIKELEARYKAMHDQLQSEIKLLNGKLNSLDEFRVQRDLLLAKFDVQEDELREKDRLHEEALYQLEQKAVVEKDAIKKEVEAKLLQVSEDFTRSSEIRNAGYTRRLIRENIALQKEIDVLVLSQIKMQQQHDDQVERHKEMREQYESLDQLKKQLIRSSQNKIHIIEKLTSNYERLKGKYVEVAKYRKLYETLVSRDVCEQFNFNDMSKKLRLLGQRIESLKWEKNQLATLHQQHETEILRLRDVIQQIKLTLHASVQAMEEEAEEVERQKHQKEQPTPAVAEEMANAAALRRHQRHNLLEELLTIVSSHSDRLPETPSVISLSRSASSVYKPGKIGFLPREPPELMEVFKTGVRKIVSIEKATEQAAPIKPDDGVYIPKARSSDKFSVIDVELGSTLYVSSSHEDVPQIEEEIVEDNEEAESSEFQSSTPSKMSLAAPAEPASMPEDVPASATTGKTSADQSEVPVTDGYEEEGEDENSINLFYGASVETQKCGQSIGDTWDCIYESSGTQAANVNRTEVSQEIGPGCRCGCIVHLGSSKPKRIIAGATQSCPGRSFWLLQVDGQETIGLALNFLRLPCVTQYIKVRDGPSLSSTLLIELKGGNNLILPAALESTGAQLLVEFYAGDVGTTNTNNNHGAGTDAAQLLTNTSASGVASMSCTGGFLANVEQIGLKNASSMDEVATTRIASVKSRVVVPKVQRLRSGFTLVHLSAVVFASIIILISALLGAQYVLRYRKYHLAVARRSDEGSRLHTPRNSLSSLHLPPSRAVSTTTLISEVIYLVKMRPKHKLRHSILRESIDAEAMARETEFDGCENLAEMTKCDEASSSSGSIATLCNAQTATMKRNDDHVPKKLELGSHSGTLTRKNSGKDSDSIISSGMSSLCNSPPLQAKRASRYSERYDAATLKMRADYGGQDCESPRSSCMRDYERLSQLGRVGRSASVSLTNGCYSPAASVVSTATIRTTSASTNPKESKEKQNRKKLLARPGSEFSLGNQEELEFDYYDYNVDNAGATPGSYLGMDPAYLIWIPPFDDVGEDADADNDDADNKKSPEAANEHEPLYEEIKMPRYGHYLSPGSNTETISSPSVSTYDELSPLSSQQQSKASSPSDTHNLKNCLIQRAITNSSNNNNNNSNNNISRPATPRLSRKQRRAAKKHCQSTMSLRTEDAGENFALHELSSTKSARSIAAVRTATTPSPEADEQSDSYVEKETTVVKSPSDLQDFLALDDIQFADESENSDQDAARELELKLREQTQVSSKQLRAKRVEASSMSGMCEVTV